jgi:hypothetical protein
MAFMTQEENRAAAKAWREYREQQRRESEPAANIAADLVELDRLWRYLIFNRRAHGADAEKLTGDQIKLHAQNHKCG